MTPQIKSMIENLRLGKPVDSVKLRLIHARVLDKPVIFCVNMKHDLIQRTHRDGQFYEMSELSQLRSIFPEGGVFVDIGANVGNHTLFAAMFLKASKVIPFEPNPRAFELLVQNVLVNGLGDVVDLSRLGVGLSDVESDGFGSQNRVRNLGRAKLLEGQGDIEVYPGHELLADETPDLIKIDVEGMEMKVLSGLEPLLKRCRPLMMVEVEVSAEDDFMAWMEAQGYAVLATHQRYHVNKNHLICDAGKIDALKASYFAQQASEDQIREGDPRKEPV